MANNLVERDNNHKAEAFAILTSVEILLWRSFGVYECWVMLIKPNGCFFQKHGKLGKLGELGTVYEISEDSKFSLLPNLTRILLSMAQAEVIINKSEELS